MSCVANFRRHSDALLAECWGWGQDRRETSERVFTSSRQSTHLESSGSQRLAKQALTYCCSSDLACAMQELVKYPQAAVPQVKQSPVRRRLASEKLISVSCTGLATLGPWISQKTSSVRRACTHIKTDLKHSTHATLDILRNT